MSPIRLTHKSFIALSSATRLRILKILEKRRMTLSEISKEMGMSKSTVSEHLEKLLEAELITIEKRGRWTYFSLTDFGRRIVDGEELVVRIVLD
ncbi:winged helix-turn-helix domain-containing protein [Archaeoglobus neptunius]|uniref:winged helix-turn-helix domain-containing protein n=1 Tax=Archaeoglobus neptunius TaxID=2798580 RepID=UPI001926C3A7|nr:winged helix-turn-helix domain-containing protein [Archaeoglobus neptunius]